MGCRINTPPFQQAVIKMASRSLFCLGLFLGLLIGGALAIRLTSQERRFPPWRPATYGLELLPLHSSISRRAFAGARR